MSDLSSNCSIIEAIELIEEIIGIEIKKNYIDKNRIGDHIWWISDISKFQTHYPAWNYSHDLREIINEIFLIMKTRI